MYDTVLEANARRQYDAEQKAKKMVDELGHFVNGMHDVEADEFANALANEHPTLLGQIAKAVGIGVMRRARRDPAWKPHDEIKDQFCAYQVDMAGAFARHAAHDGRLDCTTVIGAELMARQSFI